MEKIKLVLSDDWELRGDGSGDIHSIQFEPLRRLLGIYERYGLHASIYAEVMQQIYHRRLSSQYPHLLDLASEWDDLIKEAYSRGHDVQLHIHSQWQGATYDNECWNLAGDWSILNYPPEAIREMVRTCKGYLENLIKPINPGYTCISFRSGAWHIAPSAHVLHILAEEGIIFDTSIISGIVFNNKNILLDYSYCEETMLPYYPDMQDARKVADGASPIVCIPTFTFSYLRISELNDRLCRLRRNFFKRQGILGMTANKGASIPWEKAGFAMKKAIRFLFPILIADLSSLTFDKMMYMIEAIRHRTQYSGWVEIPIVLANHTKDLCNFEHIEAFAEYVSGQKDLEVVTLAEVAENLKTGCYKPIMKKIAS